MLIPHTNALEMILQCAGRSVDIDGVMRVHGDHQGIRLANTVCKPCHVIIIRVNHPAQRPCLHYVPTNLEGMLLAIDLKIMSPQVQVALVHQEGEGTTTASPFKIVTGKEHLPSVMVGERIRLSGWMVGANI